MGVLRELSTYITCMNTCGRACNCSWQLSPFHYASNPLAPFVLCNGKDMSYVYIKDLFYRLFYDSTAMRLLIMIELSISQQHYCIYHQVSPLEVILKATKFSSGAGTCNWVAGLAQPGSLILLVYTKNVRGCQLELLVTGSEHQKPDQVHEMGFAAVAPSALIVYTNSSCWCGS